jgi:outer membrane protein TolC
VRAKESGEVQLDFETISALLFDGNLPIHLASNRVYRSKAEVNQARTNLLPSINLGALLLSVVQPQFAWAGVEALVPFLVPENWFRARGASRLFEAEKLALQIVEQNQYASAVSLVSLWSLDRRLLSLLEDQQGDATISRQRAQAQFDLGLISNEELKRAIQDENQAEISASRVQELVTGEEASLRRALGLKPETRLRFSERDLEIFESPSEGLQIQGLVDRVMQNSPEAQQLSRLEEAGRQGKWSSVFAFMGGVSLSQPAANGRLSPSLEGLSARGGIQLSFGYFPALQISNRNLQELQLRRDEMRLEFQELLETLQGRLASARNQEVRFKELERSQETLRDATRLRVELGLAESWELDDLERALRQSRLDTLRARMNLSLARLAWQRALQEGPFERLSPCVVDLEKK